MSFCSGVLPEYVTFRGTEPSPRAIIQVGVCAALFGDAGAAVLGAALQAMPRIPFIQLDLELNELMVAGVASLAPALRRPWGDGGLKKLWVNNNPSLGDAGVAALAKALPPTLETLELGQTGCGDDGLVALVAALPALTHLRNLFMNSNPAATARGWVALAGALPSLPALWSLFVENSTGMGSEGAAALAAAVPNCARLHALYVTGCQLAAGDRARLKVLSRRNGHPAGPLHVSVDRQ